MHASSFRHVGALALGFAFLVSLASVSVAQDDSPDPAPPAPVPPAPAPSSYDDDDGGDSSDGIDAESTETLPALEAFLSRLERTVQALERAFDRVLEADSAAGNPMDREFFAARDHVESEDVEARWFDRETFEHPKITPKLVEAYRRLAAYTASADAALDEDDLADEAREALEAELAAIAAVLAEAREAIGTRGGVSFTAGENGRVRFMAMHEVPLHEVVLDLAAEFNFNVVMSGSVSGTVSLTLTDVDPVDVLAAILDVNGYKYVTRGNLWIVVPASAAPETFESALFQIPGALDFDEIRGNLATVSSTQGVLVANSQTRVILVKDGPEQVAVMRRFLALVIATGAE